jgi:hypothetical protein
VRTCWLSLKALQLHLSVSKRVAKIILETQCASVALNDAVLPYYAANQTVAYARDANFARWLLHSQFHPARFVRTLRFDMVLDGTSQEESCSLLLEVVDACCALNSIQASVVAKHAEADVLDFLRALKGLPVHALTVDCYRILPAQGGGRWLASLAGFPLRRLVLFGVNMAHIQAEDFLAFQTVEELRLDEVSLPLPQYASSSSLSLAFTS